MVSCKYSGDALFKPVLFSFIVWSIVVLAEYDYTNQDEWGSICQTGRQQSPIELEPSIRDTLDNVLRREYAEDSTVTLENDGHSIILHATDPDSLQLSNVPHSDDIYYLTKCYFRWGNAEDANYLGKSAVRGSEHLVDGQSTVLEMQCYHYNSKYANFDAAKTHEDGIVAVATFFELSPGDEGGDDSIQKVLEKVVFVIGAGETYNTPVPIDFNVASSPLSAVQYYYYRGSFTYPNCEESVLWIVGRVNRYLIQSQLSLLRAVKRDNNHVVGKNFRKNQTIYDRKVYRTFTNLKPFSISGTLVTIPSFFALSALWIALF